MLNIIKKLPTILKINYVRDNLLKPTSLTLNIYAIIVNDQHIKNIMTLF